MAWLPPHYVHPERLELSTGHHLRPIRADDVDLDYPAVMGSREQLWARYGEAWGWPPASMTAEQDRDDLARHEREIAEHLSFNYAMFDAAESRLLGCVYIDPDDDTDGGSDDDTGDGTNGAPAAVVSWWLVDELADSVVAGELDRVVPAWLASHWPFAHIRYSVV